MKTALERGIEKKDRLISILSRDGVTDMGGVSAGLDIILHETVAEAVKEERYRRHNEALDFNARAMKLTNPTTEERG